MVDSISFRLLAEPDLPLLHQWQNQPHMFPYYQKKPISLKEITAYYMPRILGQQKTYSHIAFLDAKPFGYIQCYKNMDDPEYAARKSLTDGLGIDLYIGETSLLGKGFGQKMLQQYLKNVVFKIFPEETKCYIWHNLNNIAGLKCSKAAGFKFVMPVAEEKDGLMGELLLYEK